LYWMQASQRAGFNPALEYAVEQANALGLPTVVGFGLAAFPEANARHYTFMLEGLADVADALAARGIGFVLRKQPPDALAADLAEDAALVVCDRGYLKVQRGWRERLAGRLDRRLIQVEGDVVVPVETASDHHEYAARTLRPKVLRLWDGHLHALRARAVGHRADHLVLPAGLDLARVDRIVADLKIDHRVGPVARFRGGETEARRRLAAFLDAGLDRYAEDRARPEAAGVSHLSPYLHFGQISPVEIALAVRRAGGAGVAKFLEELIVRRELAANHCQYAPDYDTYGVLPDWARKTLAEHAGDPRPHLYDRTAFEAAETHDPYWNAAMREMRATGYMHNVLRMYWGKKILHWSRAPDEAFETLLGLNNRWFLDGRDPNAFTNVGWIFGLHDRPWPAQPVFGSVRAMGPNTFKKFDADAYVRAVETLERQAQAAE
ncbi:MAG TPA: deoxyribodipyrimidine photo-lyase, partial [Phenylobacterium sp.]